MGSITLSTEKRRYVFTTRTVIKKNTDQLLLDHEWTVLGLLYGKELILV
jgi:hypothetical protein